MRPFSATTIESTKTAPGLASWGRLAGRVERLGIIRPDFLQRVTTAPPGAFHAYVIYLYSTNAARDDLSLAERMYSTPPKALLADAMTGNPLLFGALRKCGSKAYSPDFYDMLAEVLNHSGAAESLLTGDEIDQKALTLVYYAVKFGLDPLLYPACQNLDNHMKWALSFHDIVQIARSLNILKDDETEKAAIKRAGVNLRGLVERWFERAVSPHVLPDLPQELTFISSAKDLSALGLKYKNCLGKMKHKVALGMGTHIYLLFKEPGDDVGAVASLAMGAHGMWWVDECEYLDRSFAGRVVAQRIVQMSAACGMKVGIRAFESAWEDFACLQASPSFDGFLGETWANQE